MLSVTNNNLLLLAANILSGARHIRCQKIGCYSVHGVKIGEECTKFLFF